MAQPRPPSNNCYPFIWLLNWRRNRQLPCHLDIAGRCLPPHRCPASTAAFDPLGLTPCSAKRRPYETLVVGERGWAAGWGNRKTLIGGRAQPSADQKVALRWSKTKLTGFNLRETKLARMLLDLLIQCLVSVLCRYGLSLSLSLSPFDPPCVMPFSVDSSRCPLSTRISRCCLRLQPRLSFPFSRRHSLNSARRQRLCDREMNKSGPNWQRKCRRNKGSVRVSNKTSLIPWFEGLCSY